MMILRFCFHKTLFALFAFGVLVACSEADRANLNLNDEPVRGEDDDASRDESGDDGGADTDPNPVPPLPTEIELVAAKSYDPSQWQDGIFDELDDLGRDVQFKVNLPSEVLVFEGNAGNHNLTIVIDEDGANTVCTYRGGADVSRPIQTGNPTQIQKGLKYHFQSCTDGSTLADLVVVDATLRVTVNNGDRSQTTRVRARFPVTP